MTAVPAPRIRGDALRWRDDLRTGALWWALSRAFFLALAAALGAAGRAVRPSAGGPWPLNAYVRFDAGHLLRRKFCG